VRITEMNESEPLMKYWDVQPVVKTIVIQVMIGQSLAVTCLLAKRQPILRWHERYSGFYTEQENTGYWCQSVIRLPLDSPTDKGKMRKLRTNKAESTDAVRSCGLSCSS
jgi:hypothetical protein